MQIHANHIECAAMLLAALAGTSSFVEMASTAERQTHACKKYCNDMSMQHWPNYPLSSRHPPLHANPTQATSTAMG